MINDHVLKPIKVNGVDEVWSYAKQEACQHWINCLDGALAMVDQEQKLDADGGKVTLNDDIVHHYLLMTSHLCNL